MRIIHDFGWVTVTVNEKDGVRVGNGVLLKWSTTPTGVDIDAARSFLNELRRALNFAQREERRLRKPIAG